MLTLLFFFPSSLSQYSELWRCCAMTSVCYQKKVRHIHRCIPSSFHCWFPPWSATQMRPKFSGFDTHTQVQSSHFLVILLSKKNPPIRPSVMIVEWKREREEINIRKTRKFDWRKRPHTPTKELDPATEKNLLNSDSNFLELLLLSSFLPFQISLLTGFTQK